MCTFAPSAGGGAGAMDLEEEDEELKKALLMSVGKDPSAASASAGGVTAAGAAAGAAGGAGERVPVAEKVNKEILEQLVDMVGSESRSLATTTISCPLLDRRRTHVRCWIGGAGLPTRPSRQGDLAGGCFARSCSQLVGWYAAVYRSVLTGAECTSDTRDRPAMGAGHLKVA